MTKMAARRQHGAKEGDENQHDIGTVDHGIALLLPRSHASDGSPMSQA
jgi:hypothetical protein